MASSTTANAMVAPAKKVLVPIAFGIEEIEATVIVEILRRSGAEVTVASVEQDLQIEASRRVKLVPDDKLESCMPGSSRLRDSELLKRMTVAQSEQGKLVATICVAPAVALQEWGILEGRKATCHPSFIDKLTSSLTVGSKVQTDGHINTSRGPGTAIESALSPVEQLYGKQKFEEVLVPLANGSEEMEAVMIIDILRRAGMSVTVTSIEKFSAD
ncbi:hypothetical protein KP509_17G066300 [Ceratopteris richardii]|uniref:DJ-1/PfpI domain-containing protein n=1 Tax=Ceratopteris richardii TaxID=49495 RepID=A0A8T2SUW9_CERRI|nr:hypothetical protein KP509_17G066300 [Ceratopteris richardii]